MKVVWVGLGTELGVTTVSNCILCSTYMNVVRVGLGTGLGVRLLAFLTPWKTLLRVLQCNSQTCLIWTHEHRADLGCLYFGGGWTFHPRGRDFMSNSKGSCEIKQTAHNTNVSII